MAKCNYCVKHDALPFDVPDTAQGQAAVMNDFYGSYTVSPLEASTQEQEPQPNNGQDAKKDVKK